VSARLHLAAQPTVQPTRTEQWPLRSVDFDVLGHVNNSVYCAMLEHVSQVRGLCEQPLTMTLEHHEAIDPMSHVVLQVVDVDGGIDLWITTPAGRTVAVAELRTLF
jgi:acyl-ACP thioesterase